MNIFSFIFPYEITRYSMIFHHGGSTDLPAENFLNGVFQRDECWRRHVVRFYDSIPLKSNQMFFSTLLFILPSISISNSPFPCPQTRNFRASLLDFTSLRFDPFFSSSRKFLKAIQITIATKSRWSTRFQKCHLMRMLRYRSHSSEYNARNYRKRDLVLGRAGSSHKCFYLRPWAICFWGAVFLVPGL
jgi:hypothetical protein